MLIPLLHGNVGDNVTELTRSRGVDMLKLDGCNVDVDKMNTGVTR